MKQRIGAVALACVAAFTATGSTTAYAAACEPICFEIISCAGRSSDQGCICIDEILWGADPATLCAVD